jgi:sec-independent protein translocase protein TatA
MGSFSLWHWIVVAVIVLLLFGGRGKISQLMGDFAQGIKAFKKGMADEEKAVDAEPGETKPKTIADAKSPDSVKQHSQTERKFEGSTS